MEIRGWTAVRQRLHGLSLAAWATGMALLVLAVAPVSHGTRSVLAICLAPVLVAVTMAGLAPAGLRWPAARHLWPAGAWLAGLSLSALVNGSAAAALLPSVLGLTALWVGWRLRPSDAGPLAVFLGVAAASAAVYGLSQYLGWDPLPRQDEFPDRIVGPFINPNHMGSFAAVALPALLALHLRAVGSSSSSRSWVGPLSAATILIVYASLLLAGSRGALWAALVGGLLVILGYARSIRLGECHRRLAGPLALLAAMIVVTVLLQRQPVMEGPEGRVSVGERLGAMSNLAGEAARRDHTVTHRYMLWRAAGGLFVEHPWLGVGPGRFAEATRSRLAATAGEEAEAEAVQAGLIVPHAHNEALQLAAEAGLAGLLPLVWLVICGIGGGGRAAWRTGDLQLWGAIGGCSAALTHGLVSYPLHLPATALATWILFGITLNLTDSTKYPDK